MAFPDFDFILNNALSLAIVLSPVELAALFMVYRIKHGLDLVLGPISNNPLMKNIWAMMNALGNKTATSSKMAQLSEKGVAARQFNQEIVGAIASVDPAKAFLVPWIENAVRERFGKGNASMVIPILQQVPINFTEALMQFAASDWVKGKFPAAGAFTEELKAYLTVQKAAKIG